ncbi:MAG TPA: alpha/beta hydrolase [Gemmatimonadales bacterium]|nr:alpha/beta hydrolase [Gemmatimonadales bacterium]
MRLPFSARRRGAAVVLALGALGCRATPIPERERWPGASWETHDRVVDGTTLRVLDAGVGPPVVFVHGLGASMYTWRAVLRPVLAAGHRVVAFDNRGFGFSERPDSGYGNAAYTRLLVALLDSLGIADAVLVGHSMGGAISAQAAIDHPARVRGLVLIGPAGYGVSEPWSLRVARLPLAGRLLSGLRGRWTVAQLLRSTYGDPSRLTKGDVDQYYATAAVPRSTVALRGVFRDFRFDALRGRLGRVQAPTLLIWGAQDRWIPMALGREMALQLANGALVPVPGAGHNVQEERPDEVVPTLLAFLSAGLPRPPGDLAVDTPRRIDKSTE